MKSVVFMSTLMMILPVASSVGAQENADESSDAVWSVGAGVSFGSYYSGGLSGQSSLSCLDSHFCYSPYGFLSLPKVQFVLERKLTRSLKLMMEIIGAYENTDEYNQNSDDKKNSEKVEIGAVVGVRWVINPGGVVEVSPTFALRGLWGWTDKDADYLSGEQVKNGRIDTYSYSAGALAGLVLERKLLENLFLRLESSLLHVTYSRFELSGTSGGEIPSASTNRFSAGLAFNPSLQLRLQF